MDGTLIDSEPLHLLAYHTILSRWGHTYTEEDNRNFLGKKDSDVCRALIARLNLDVSADELIAIKEAVTIDLMKTASPRDGVYAILGAGRARSVPLAVASFCYIADNRMRSGRSRKFANFS